MNHAEYAGSLSQVLYRSTDIRKGLEDLFGQHSGRRVLLVAFIGEDWQAFMRPEAMRGMTVVCAPSPATSAIALIQMIALGAKIFFSPKLHMKVYWAEERGCIIGSANLSHNAMGEEGLKEVGVLLRPEAVDIDRLIAEADAVPATDQSLADLAKKNREAERALPPIFPRKSRTFLEWYRTDAIVRAPWKLGWWDEQAAPSTVSKNAAEEITGRRHIENHLECGKNHYKENDWILSFRLSSGTVDRAAWMFVDYVSIGVQC